MVTRHFVMLLTTAGCIVGRSALGTEPSSVDLTSPATVVWDGRYLGQLQAANRRPQDVADAFDRVRTQADLALSRGPYTVTQKETLPPSGDRHDYQSFSRYWWPNPATADGLPYVRRDGQVNRELLRQGDRQSLGALVDDVEALSLAYFYLNDRVAGRRATELVKTWFLDPRTRMNPHLRYGQAVPGKADGRGVGIIDTRGFMLILESIALLDESVGWGRTENDDLKQWFQAYSQWLETSELGREELSATNNHGSWYDAQLARYALFADDIPLAKATLEAVKTRRLNAQFERDGRQPAELKRTLSLHYCMFNLSALVTLARVGEHPLVAVDLWSFVPANGCGLQRAFDFLLPYLGQQDSWEFEQISPYRLSRRSHLALRFASRKYGDEKYQRVAQGLPVRHAESDFAVLLAAPYRPPTNP